MSPAINLRRDARQRARGEAWSAVDAIRSEAARLGMPRHFRTDLDHDQRAILSRAGQGHHERSFGWAVHDGGTFMAHACAGPTCRDEHTRMQAPHRYMRAVAEAFRGSVIRWYLYTPTAGLVPMPDAETLDRALAAIDSEAREAVL